MLLQVLRPVLSMLLKLLKADRSVAVAAAVEDITPSSHETSTSATFSNDIPSTSTAAAPGAALGAMPIPAAVSAVVLSALRNMCKAKEARQLAGHDPWRHGLAVLQTLGQRGREQEWGKLVADDLKQLSDIFQPDWDQQKYLRLVRL